MLAWRDCLLTIEGGTPLFLFVYLITHPLFLHKKQVKFSQRIGIVKINPQLEREGLSEPLKNILWNVIIESVVEPKSEHSRNDSISPLYKFYKNLWGRFFKWPIDTLPTLIGSWDYRKDVDSVSAKQYLRVWYFNAAKWYEVFDLLEYLVKNENDIIVLPDVFNLHLKDERSAYRFIDNSLIELNNEEEVQEIETAINQSGKFKSVKTHLIRALELYSDRKNPDFRNSIKESISAIESLVKTLLKDEKATLGAALKAIEDKYKIPKSLKTAFSALYGYTSDESGIRHSLIDNNIPAGVEEARFMLVTCSAFINYLVNKSE